MDPLRLFCPHGQIYYGHRWMLGHCGNCVLSCRKDLQFDQISHSDTGWGCPKDQLFYQISHLGSSRDSYQNY